MTISSGHLLIMVSTNNYPAVGMTFGLDVIYEALMLKGAITGKPPVDLYIIPMGTEMACLMLVTELRNKGPKVDVEMANRKLKKSLDFANKQGIPYVVILGENELKSGKVMLKEMLKGTKYEVKLDELEVILKEMLGKGDKMKIKVLFLDFYGTMVYKDGEVISRICERIRKASPSCPETRDIASYWWKNSFRHVSKAMVKTSGFKGILSWNH